MPSWFAEAMTILFWGGIASAYVYRQWRKAKRGWRNMESGLDLCARSSCRHQRLFHVHYRKGTNCSVCGCPKFRRF